MIFVTGASGFVGKSIADYLEAAGMPVCRVDRSFVAATSELSTDQPSCIIHCAWAGVFGSDRDSPIQYENLQITNALIRFALSSKATHVIAFGSQAEYGLCQASTTEKTPLNPRTLYGQLKVECHKLLQSLLAEHDIKLTWLRLYDPYGPRDNPAWFLPFIIQSALRDKSPELTNCTQIWDYIYIDDICRLVLLLVRFPPVRSDVFNLASGKPVLLKNVVEMVFNTIKPKTAIPLYGARPFRPDQQHFVSGSIAKLTNSFDWMPQTPLTQGIKNTIAYFKSYSASE